MSIGLSRDREVAIRQFLPHHKKVVQSGLQAPGVLYVRSHDPMITLEAFAVPDDEFDVDAPSAARPTRDEPDVPEPSGIQKEVGHEVAELGVGTEHLPRVDVEVQTEAFTPEPRRQLFVSPTQTASPSGEEISPEEAAVPR